MKAFFDILRGVVIGLANIIPGVSGGTMMVSMGIYDTIIGCINSLFKDFKRCIKTLWPYALGMVLGILGLAKLITFLLGTYPLPTNMAFIEICRQRKHGRCDHCIKHRSNSHFVRHGRDCRGNDGYPGCERLDDADAAGLL